MTSCAARRRWHCCGPPPPSSSLAVSSLLAGLALVGTGPLAGLSGQPVGAARGALLVLASWALVLPGAWGFAALGVLAGALSRSSAVGVAVPVVAGLAMSLLAQVPGSDLLRHLLLGTSLGTWHGVLLAPVAPVPVLRGAAVGLAWTAVCLVLAERAVLRREVSGG